ncbi:alpha/beta hydrolase [Streptomyces sp. NBC_01283]|uniref:hypothetical protein n=1 Tax=Streptomyces sp. NBC_01283 TaxID=2903812 RepID=UPI00352F7A8E|nr:alpha/beta hydrolase [Streptomyces sp. NBC_01283]
MFGPYVNGMIAPCAFWAAEPREPGTAIANDAPVLILQARHDNAVNDYLRTGDLPAHDSTCVRW